MIGDNIKSLRKTHDLTQPEFAKIVGISRNSLSRYENGTSSVSTELIDRICQKFNVSYVDIVGEDKMLTPLESRSDKRTWSGHFIPTLSLPR